MHPPQWVLRHLMIGCGIMLVLGIVEAVCWLCGIQTPWHHPEPPR